MGKWTVLLIAATLTLAAPWRADAGESGAGRAPSPAASPGPGDKACVGCHTKLAKEIKAARHVHGPVAVGECTFCHSPHPGKGPSKLKAALDQLCFRCHERARGGKAAGHRQQPQGCTRCHDPHSGADPHFLRRKAR